MNRLFPLLALCAAPWISAGSQSSSNSARATVAEIAADQRPQSAQTNSDCVIVHRLVSEFQAGTNDVRVLLPDKLKSGRRYPVLYLLPVYAGGQHAADAMDEARRLGLSNRHGIICVSPAFERLPWYADHPQDRQIRQESHFLKAVLPFVENHYPALAEPRGRLLAGFSKSGWGAFSLLLRHPDVFGRAASWDAPLLMDRIGMYGNGPIFGTQENFEQYCATRLLAQQAESFRRNPARLILLGHGNFVEDDALMHQQMQLLGIPHFWDHGPKRAHDWHSGWLEIAVELLLRESLASESQPHALRLGNAPPASVEWARFVVCGVPGASEPTANENILEVLQEAGGMVATEVCRSTQLTKGRNLTQKSKLFTAWQPGSL